MTNLLSETSQTADQNDQPDFAPLHEAHYQELVADGLTVPEIPAPDPTKAEQPDFSPLFIDTSRSLTRGRKRTFASLVERESRLW